VRLILVCHRGFESKTLIWDGYRFKFKGEIGLLYELTNRLIFDIEENTKRSIYCYNKQTGKKIWRIAPPIDENGKSLNGFYLGIGINILSKEESKRSKRVGAMIF
jgi:outer membrane protein assembly factor BamB